MPHIVCLNISPRQPEHAPPASLAELMDTPVMYGPQVDDNVQPWFEGESDAPKPKEHSHHDMPDDWRNALEMVIIQVTARFWKLSPDGITCSFPHDPSVPTDPYPLATVIVELLFDMPERTHAKRATYAKKLATAIKKELNRLRRTTDAKVEVAVKRFDPKKDGFFVTP